MNIGEGDQKEESEEASNKIHTSELLEWGERLKGRLSEIPGRSLSPEIEKHIRKRVSPGSVDRYLSLEAAIDLCLVDIEMLTVRIHQYRMIEFYPRHFLDGDREIFTAFMAHHHALRSSELYLIQERGSELLKFFFDLAVNLGIETKNQSRGYEAVFKERFKRRLLERHRLVHVHERPSLMTRLIDVFSNDIDKGAVAEIISDAASKLIVAYEALKAGNPAIDVGKINITEIQNEVRKVHSQGYVEEVSLMYELIRRYFKSSFSLWVIGA